MLRPEQLRRFFIRVWAIATKEATHIRRDPRTLYLALGMPVLLLIIFGYGVRFDLDHVKVSWVDLDRTAASRELHDAFFASGELAEEGNPQTVEEAEALLRDGAIAAALVVPRGLAGELQRGERVDLQLLVDGSNGMTTNQVMAKAEAIGRAQSAGSGTPPLRVEVLTRYNPTGESAMFLVPGLIAYVLALTAVLLTALTVAREWERGSMEQLFSTPVSRLEIVVGKLLPYFGLGVLDVLLALAAGTWLFSMPLRGNLLLVGLGSMLFLVGMLGQGLLVSVVTRNQMIATQVGALSSMLPSLLLSGFLFPVDNMPLPLRMLSMLVPARWFVALLRGVLLRDASLMSVWPYLAFLALFAFLMLAVSTARFQRRIA